MSIVLGFPRKRQALNAQEMIDRSMTANVDQILDGKHILLGMGGSISAYRAVELIRLLKSKGAAVQVAPTRSCLEFVGALTLETLSGRPCLQKVLEVEGGRITHVEAAYEADCTLIAPATAGLMARMVQGMADEALLATLLSFRGPLLIAPAMETRMWEHPATQANVATLTQRGAHFVGPAAGALASGRSGLGRLAPLEQIVEAVCRALTPSDLEGKQVLITAGPTVEDLDPVRFLSNRSSGRMGVALAKTAARRGATVHLVHGPTDHIGEIGADIQTYPVRNAEQMHQAVIGLLDQPSSFDAVVCAAAVADYTPAEVHAQKIKKADGHMETLPLERTKDILATIGQRSGRPFLVGFAAETEELVGSARDKMSRKGCDMICANDVSQTGIGFASSENQLTLLFSDGSKQDLPRASKETIADSIWSSIVMRLKSARRPEAIGS